MMNGGRIPVPWKHRWRRFRYGTLPSLGLIAFVAATLWLWTRQGEMPHSIGEVEVVRVDVASALSGVLAPLPQGPWTLYETVEANQVVARLDERLLQSQMATLVQELARLRKELDAASAKLVVSEADRARGYLDATIRLYIEQEERSLVVLEREVQVAIDRLEAERTKTHLECLQPLYVRKIVSDLEMTNARIYAEEAAKRLEETNKVLGEAQTQEKNAEQRLAKFPAFQPADVFTELAPIIAAANVQQARIDELEIEISRLTIRAPIGGRISAILHWPNENVRAGEAIVTIAAEKGRYIVSYVRQEQHVEPAVGMEVDVRKRLAISPPMTTVVERVGPQVELVPEHLRRDPKMPEWGLPVRITIPKSKDFAGRPGELFEATFKTHPTSAGY